MYNKSFLIRQKLGAPLYYFFVFHPNLKGVGTFSSVKSKKKRKERDMFNCFLINVVPWSGILSFFCIIS